MVHRRISGRSFRKDLKMEEESCEFFQILLLQLSGKCLFPKESTSVILCLGLGVKHSNLSVTSRANTHMFVWLSIGNHGTPFAKPQEHVGMGVPDLSSRSLTSGGSLL